MSYRPQYAYPPRNEAFERRFRAALDAIYAKYGPDFAAFFRDVQRDIEAERERRAA